MNRKKWMMTAAVAALLMTSACGKNECGYAGFGGRFFFRRASDAFAFRVRFAGCFPVALVFRRGIHGRARFFAGFVRRRFGCGGVRGAG